MKIVILLLLLAILYSLGSAVFYLVRERDSSSRKTYHALLWRMILSVALFLFLMLGAYMGWIHPHDSIS